MIFKNIKVKILFWYTLITVLVLFIFSAVLLNQFHKESLKGVDKQLETVINEINYMKHFYKPFDLEEFMIKNLYINIYEHKEGEFKKVGYSEPTMDAGKLNVLEKTTFEHFTKKRNIRVVRFHSNKSSKDIYIEVLTTLDDKINPSLEGLREILFTLIPILLMISIFAGYMIIKNSLEGVKKTIDEVKSIESHNLKQRVSSYTMNDEIEELVQTFNFLLDKLDESFCKIKRFSNDVSHELKTPLTVIRGEIELGLRKERSNEEYKRILSNILEETKRLQELINSLLFLSKANDKEIKSKFEIVELDDIITDVISSNRKLLEDKRIKFEFRRLESVSCRAHPLLIKIMVGNIIENGIKYSNNDSVIDIYLDENILKIKDYGLGIREEDLESIFDRFYQVDKSRGQGGYGLGLSIVKSIAKIHGFKMEVKSRYGEFTEFIIKL